MKYLILVYESDEDFARRGNEHQAEYWGAWRAYHEALKAAGVYVGGHRLQAPGVEATVRIEHGQHRIQDGLFADTKEQLGGVIVIDTMSLGEALVWAERCPAARYGAVELRPIASAEERTSALSLRESITAPARDESVRVPTNVHLEEA